MLALLFLVGTLAAAPGPVAEREFKDLTPGRYSVKLTGVRCHACLRAVVEELIRNKNVEQAVQDLDAGAVTIGVRGPSSLKVSALQRHLDRAARRVNLGGQIGIASIAYVP